MIHEFDWDKALLPKRLNNPHDYVPASAVRFAAELLRAHLRVHSDANELIAAELATGKMMGVLIVEKADGELGLLMGFSGLIAGRSVLNGFVPPIYDLKSAQSYFADDEARITQINEDIVAIESSSELAECRKAVAEKSEENKQKIELARAEYRMAKMVRDAKRAEGLNESEELELQRVSQREKGDLRRFEVALKAEIEVLREELNAIETKIEELKMERAERSKSLQRKLFDSYILINGRGESKSMFEIFDERYKRLPPAAAGECAAPKLLDYALRNSLRPRALGEFWVGESPRSELRRDGDFYGACRGKCEPILAFVLQGVDCDEAPKRKQVGELKVLFEDEYIIALDKPAGLLSVRGRSGEPSVAEWLEGRCEGAQVVHRLDQDTSGILLVAKDLEVFKTLQKMFAKREISKTYIALLAGDIRDKGEGEIKLPLSADFENRPRQRLDYEHGKFALTTYSLLDYNAGKSRVLLSPHTGRTHQLRVHAAHPEGLNAPIVGDRLYGDASESERLMLHASRLVFRHPIGGNMLTIESEATF